MTSCLLVPLVQLGRMDLTEVEGLADLLAAETEVQRQQAVAAAGGAARQQCDAWRAMLLRCLARVEAVIDFGEDDGIGDDVAAGVVKDINALRTELETHLAAASGGELLREGVRVALVGPPNAGKSSLLNTLAGREVAIVSPVAGTTRDVLEVALDLGGYKVWVTDGAGVRGTDDPVEAEGVRRATAAAAAAHVVVNLREPGGAWAPLPELDGDDESQNRRPKPMLRVLSKADLLGTGGMAAGEQGLDCRISCVTGEGLGQLLAILTSAVEAVVRDAAHQGALRGSPTLLNRARHRHHVAACVAALRRYEAAPMALEVAAEELRAAAAALGRVTGAIDTENVLDSIFSEFCIGK